MSVAQHDIDSPTQLRFWVAGNPMHRKVSGLAGGECCPDFSCCRPALLASEDERKAFLAADEKVMAKFLGIFLRRMLGEAFAKEEKKAPTVFIAGVDEDESN